MSTVVNIIAIDGPAASGKSTLGLRLSKALGYLFFDTGVMYRAITWLAIQRGINLEESEAVTDLAESVEIEIAPASQSDGRTSDIFADGMDLTWNIRRPEVDSNVSLVSAYPGVRKAMTQQQRRIGLRGKIVMVGRDIGTVVLPEAPLKIFLDASAEERARRRFHEILSLGGEADYNIILEKIQKRDAIDSTRDVAPLKAAQDAWIIDSDQLDADQVFYLVMQRIQNIEGKTSSNLVNR